MKPTSLLPLCLLLAGCTPNQGDFKYIGQKPTVRLTVVSTKYRPAKVEYEPARLELSGVAQQTTPFPVKHYSMAVRCEGKLSNDKPFSSFLAVEMKDGSGSFTDDIYLDTGLTTPNLKMSSLTVKECSWTPYSPANAEIEIKD